MGKRYKPFKMASINIDFKQTNLVTKELVTAIEHYKRFEMFELGDDIDNSITNLTDAGTIAYRAMEHAYKNYIFRYYKEEYDKGRISQTEFDGQIDFLTKPVEGRFVTHKDLKDKFCSIISKPKVDVKLIFDGATKSNNGPKHEFTIPDPVGLKMQISEMVKFFNIYISANEKYPSLADTILGDEFAWIEFLNDCDDFSNAYQFVLVAPPTQPNLIQSVDRLFCIHWDLVIDFYSKSDIDGLMHEYISNCKISPVTRMLNYANRTKGFKCTTSTQWVMANGFEDQPDSVASTYRIWKRKYGQNLSDVLRKFRSTYSKPIKMIILANLDEEYMHDVIESCADAFVESDGVTISGIDIIVIDGATKCLELDDDFIKRTTLSNNELMERLGAKKEGTYSYALKRKLPGLKPGEELPDNLFSKLEDFCEVVFSGIELKDAFDDVKSFYNGSRQINWSELSRHADLERKIYATKIYKPLIDIMNSHPHGFYDIPYKPGFGGTTLLRRIAWDFHEMYPVLIINKYEREDISYLKQLYGITKKTLLLLIDSNFVSRDIAKSIGVELKTEGISYTVIYMRRMERITDGNVKSCLFSLPELDYENGEVQQLVNMFFPYAINEVCRKRINIFIENPEKCEERSPFYLAFSTFDEEFVGIYQYIKNFMKPLTSELRIFLVFMAIADYINKPLDIQFFARILRNDAVVDFLSETGAFRTLVSFIPMPNQQVFCKIKYSALAKEILRQASCGFQEERVYEIKYLNLIEYIIDFIDMSRFDSQIRNNNVVEFLREMLITRRADFDAVRPKFAKIITQIGMYNTGISEQWSQEGQAAVSRIFHRLVDKYPEDSHFRAHLARYLCYVEKSYDEAINLLDEALDMSSEEEQGDSLLLHMKAMIYSARIIQKTISDIQKNHYANGSKDIEDELLALLKSDLNSARNLFKQVRGKHSGIAGHISDISLCINIIDMGKELEETDTATFLENHYGDWYLELADHANSLFDECEDFEEELDDEEKDRIADIRLQISTIRDGIERTIELYTQCLENVSAEKRPYIRRHLARAYAEKNIISDNQDDWHYIASLMTENIKEDPANESNIRSWFNAIVNIISEDPEDLLRQAIIRLNEWVALNDKNIEAQYYRYILTFIQAVEGITDAESRLSGYLAKMKLLATGLSNKTTIRYWLGKEGRGIERLIPKRIFPLNDVGQASGMLRVIKGRVSEKYANDFNAYISAYHTDIFFSPNATDGRINVTNKNAPVTLGIGFSYDGPRAYNSSVRLYTGEKYIKEDYLPPLKYGTIVKCKVIKNSTEHYINVSLVGYANEEGSIAIDCLAKPYSNLHRPTIDGPLLEAMVLNSKKVISRGGVYKNIWALTMDILDLEGEESLSPFQKQLKECRMQITE